MSSRRTVRQLVVAVLVGILVGGGLMAVTPAGAEVSSALATNWKKIWKKEIRPRADKRYYTKKQSDGKYQPKGSYETAGSGYTKAETYSKAEADSKYQPKGNYALDGSSYTKAEIDAKLAPLVNSVAATAGGDQSLDLTPADQVARSVSLMPPANGSVIVSSSAYILGSVAGHTRCSITTGTSLDGAALQIVTPGASAFQSISGTRGFAVTKGALFTVNLVCDESTGEASLGDSSLTAIFAPS
ncbi:hypothetical protein [Nocardioides sp. zg-1230]|uniref:hypothetical protein n=1 Tax=Nocardioides sp. zg-1230 TaxID=2736601 RepID=UPI001554466B|nr:hypothetical protein [Nocardioides sp. zg-1230]NPC45200.1 hypothetical protein [Nocardioides sp. zg-1230]